MEKLADGFKGQKAILIPYNIRQIQSLNSITKQLYVTHIGYFPEAKHHYRERKYGAKEYIIIYCSQGEGWIFYNHEKFELKQHEVFIVESEMPHSYGASLTNPWSIYWVHFCGQDSNQFRSIFGKVIQLHESENSRISDRILLFEEMYQNLEMGYSTENLEYISYCLRYFLATLKYLNQYHEIKNAKEMDVIQKSILYMKNNLETKITLSGIASHTGYSNSHFGAMFFQRTSYTPMDYYNQLKIQRACSYLQFSDLKIKEIAFRLGYYDPFHFSKTFRYEMKMTPSEYRANYKKEKPFSPE